MDEIKRTPNLPRATPQIILGAPGYFGHCLRIVLQVQDGYHKLKLAELGIMFTDNSVLGIVVRAILIAILGIQYTGDGINIFVDYQEFVLPKCVPSKNLLYFQIDIIHEEFHQMVDNLQPRFLCDQRLLGNIKIYICLASLHSSQIMFRLESAYHQTIA
jgi:hypothetical protein